ncbi:DUF302 domain-containing protein [Methylocapsa acidiphila]|uniref:DUF302 domain-containing protein n=1 Tax=Methylocapsa acidiphila TaxID=133552 RepID=UPI000416A5B9|nr:DUF302 domain-containing protein [Methylocapsa acidiphila]
MPTDGLATLPSAYSADDTIRRLEAAIEARGLAIFAKIDHAAGAAEVGLALRPTFLVIFGNARAGTPLMQDNQEIGIDLPLKALIWQDAAGKAWVGYNDPAWLAARHRLGSETAPAAEALAHGIAALAKEVAGC